MPADLPWVYFRSLKGEPLGVRLLKGPDWAWIADFAWFTVEEEELVLPGLDTEELTPPVVEEAVLLHAAAAVTMAAAAAAAIATGCTRLMVIARLPLVCAGVKLVATTAEASSDLTIIFEIAIATVRGCAIEWLSSSSQLTPSEQRIIEV
jgi:hypothetical protein